MLTCQPHNHMGMGMDMEIDRSGHAAWTVWTKVLRAWQRKAKVSHPLCSGISDIPVLTVRCSRVANAGEHVHPSCHQQPRIDLLATPIAVRCIDTALECLSMLPALVSKSYALQSSMFASTSVLPYLGCNRMAAFGTSVTHASVSQLCARRKSPRRCHGDILIWTGREWWRLTSCTAARSSA